VAALSLSEEYDLWCWLVSSAAILDPQPPDLRPYVVGCRYAAKNDRHSHAQSPFKLRHYRELEFDAGNLSEAVKWWIKSIVVQVGTKNADSWTPFLRLAYVAEGFGLRSANAHLLGWVDRIQNVRYNAAGANEIYRLVERDRVPVVARAIELLDREYVS
jgi:hypothetical protein